MSCPLTFGELVLSLDFNKLESGGDARLLRLDPASKDPAGKGSVMDPHSLMGKSCVSQGILVITSSEMLNSVLNILHRGRLC